MTSRRAIPFWMLFGAGVCAAACSSQGQGSGTSSSGAGPGSSGSTSSASTATASSGSASGASSTTSGGTTGVATTGSSSGSSSSSSTSNGTGGTTGSSADAGIAGLGEDCDPTAVPDSCASDGLICDPQSSTCQLPGELSACFSSIGCSSPQLVCTPGFQQGNQAVSICARDCLATTDCPLAETTCQSLGQGSSICFIDFCAQDGTGFFASCPSASAADGECLPYDVSEGMVGICIATGSVANGAPCTGSRSAGGGVDGLCVAGSNCASYGGEGQPVVSVCQPVCDSSATPTGPTCSSADLCAGFAGTGYGDCLEICGADTTVTCPTGTTCQNLSFANGLYTLCVPTD
jgi:hypothetical protein